jgi:hypothetical protein
MLRCNREDEPREKKYRRTACTLLRRTAVALEDADGRT